MFVLRIPTVEKSDELPRDDVWNEGRAGFLFIAA